MAKEPYMDTKINIIIADDHPVFRQGLAMTLKKSKTIGSISQASNGEEVLKLLESDHHQLVLMDLRMPVLDGLKTTEIISTKFKKTKVIALSMLDDQDTITNAIKRGVHGYILKNADASIILEAIDCVVSGKSYYSTEVSNMIVDNIKKPNQNEIEEELDLSNPLILDIIYLLCQELSNHQIGELVFKSHRTIEFHRNRIIKKTNSKKIIGVLKYALQNGILDDQKLIHKWKEKLERFQ
ncbi:MAG TPA: response regulator transcription factor [Bacteroidia bacterium]|nr:response regulator transcription factor [Bacteroidia bacterium]